MLKNKDLLKILSKFEKQLDQYQSSVEKQLLIAYKRSLDQIRVELSRLYEQYGDQITEKSYTNLGRLKNIREQILNNVKSILKDLHNFDYETTNNAIRDFYTYGFNNTVNALEQTIGTKLSSGLFSEDMVKAAIKNKYDKIGWGKRTVENINDLNAAIKTEITQGIILGRSYSDAANRIKAKLNIGATKALRIVRTETHRAQNTGMINGFEKTEEAAKELGIKVERVWQHNSKRDPRSNHILMDGQVADENGMFTFTSGINAGEKTKGPGLSGLAEEDINCGCTVIMRIKSI